MEGPLLCKPPDPSSEVSPDCISRKSRQDFSSCAAREDSSPTPCPSPLWAGSHHRRFRQTNTLPGPQWALTTACRAGDGRNKGWMGGQVNGDACGKSCEKDIHRLHSWADFHGHFGLPTRFQFSLEPHRAQSALVTRALGRAVLGRPGSVPPIGHSSSEGAGAQGRL